VTQNGFYFSNGTNGQQVTLSTANETFNIDIATGSSDFRTIAFTLYLSCDHGDDNPFHAHGVQYEGPSTLTLNLSPWQIVGNPAGELALLHELTLLIDRFRLLTAELAKCRELHPGM